MKKYLQKKLYPKVNMKAQFLASKNSKGKYEAGRF
jgi:hypothetical protein